MPRDSAQHALTGLCIRANFSLWTHETQSWIACYGEAGMQENRQFERYTLSVEVEMTYSGSGKMLLNTRDISTGGVFLYMQGTSLPPIGSELLLKLTGLVAGEEPSTARVRVVRVTAEGIGLEFLDR